MADEEITAADTIVTEASSAVEAPAPAPDADDAPDDAPVTVNILKSFTLTLQDGTQRRIAAGANLLPVELANHWFVRHHSDAPPPVDLVPGMPEFLAQKQREAATEKVIEAAIEQADAGLKETIRGALRRRRQHSA